MGHLFYAASSFVHHFIAIKEFKFELQSGNTQLGSKLMIFFVSCDLEISWITLKNNRTPVLCRLCGSFSGHWWIQTGVTMRKWPIWVKINYFLAVWPWNLTDDLGNNRPPLLSDIKLCASFHHHIWIQTGITVRKWLNWVSTTMTLTFDLDLWPWPFAWTSLLSLVITQENFMMIRWGKNS